MKNVAPPVLGKAQSGSPKTGIFREEKKSTTEFIVSFVFLCFLFIMNFILCLYSRLSLSRIRLSRISAYSKWKSGPCFNMEI